MFSIIQVGSSQYKVFEGDTIEVDRINEKDGQAITIDKVLLYAKGADVRVGQPHLKDIKIKAKIVSPVLGKKVIAFKYRRRKNSATRIGNRHKKTAINIAKISAE